MHQGWWMVSLDLKDVYLHVLILPSHWQHLWFSLRNAEGECIVCQWKVFLFGLDTALMITTKLLAPVVTYLHLHSAGMSHASLHR